MDLGVEGMRYPSDLTTKQWNMINESSLMPYCNDIVKTGCQWRQLPHDFLHYKTVSSFYQRSVKSGLWEIVMDELAAQTRMDAGGEMPFHHMD
jgi:transposase